MAELGDYDAAVRIHESIKRAVTEHVEKATPNRFIGWVLDARYDSSPNYGPLDVDYIGEPGTKVKVATVVTALLNEDGTPLTDSDGRVFYSTDRSNGVIQAVLPGNITPLMDSTAVWIEGVAGNYRITDVLPSPYNDYNNSTLWQSVVKLRDTLLTGRTGLLHTYGPYDYPLGNDPTKIVPAQTLQNLCTCPGFEVSIGAWAATAGSTIATSTTHKSKGVNGGGITWSVTDANAAVRIPFDSEVGETYTAAIKVWNNNGSGWIGLGDGATGAPVNKTAYYNNETFGIKYVQFKAISVLSNLNITLQALDASGTMHLWIDEIIITKGASIIAAFDGSDAGCSWTGATGLSTSIKAIPATQPIITSHGNSVKYGSPIYIPFYSATIGIGQSYYLGSWSINFDTPENYTSPTEVSSGIVELTVSLWAGNDSGLGGTTSDAKFNTAGNVQVVKKYTFDLNPSSYDGYSDWVLIYAKETTGPINGVDFDLEILCAFGHEFSLRIIYTRDDSPTRTPKFMGSVKGWTDVENISDITELDPGSLSNFGHRGTLEYQATHFKAKATSNSYVDLTGSYDPARLRGPLSPPAYHYPSLTQDLLSGGGNWSYTSGCINWDQLLIASSGARSSLQRDGYVYFNGSATGDVIPVYGEPGVTSVTTTVNGIPLAAGQTLYCELWIGGHAGGYKDYRIVSWTDPTAQFEIPSHWIMIAAIDVFGTNIKTGTGIQIPITLNTVPWINVTPAGTWTNVGGVNVPLRYCKLNAIVYIQGLVHNTAALLTGSSSTVMTLPIKFRPGFDLFFPTQWGQSGTSLPPARIQVASTGVVSILEQNATTANTGSWAMNVNFPVEQ